MGPKLVASFYILLKKIIVVLIGGVVVFITYISYVPNFTESEASNLGKGTSSISFALSWGIQTRTATLSVLFIFVKTWWDTALQKWRNKEGSDLQSSLSYVGSVSQGHSTLSAYKCFLCLGGGGGANLELLPSLIRRIMNWPKQTLSHSQWPCRQMRVLSSIDGIQFVASSPTICVSLVFMLSLGTRSPSECQQNKMQKSEYREAPGQTSLQHINNKTGNDVLT
jgi:hypothetical protein